MLLRFEDVFGTAAGQIPPGTPVRAAWLELDTTNPGDGANVFRMVDPWEPGDTWTSFGGDGIRPGQEAEPGAVAVVTAPGAAFMVLPNGSSFTI